MDVEKCVMFKYKLLYSAVFSESSEICGGKDLSYQSDFAFFWY